MFVPVASAMTAVHRDHLVLASTATCVLRSNSFSRYRWTDTQLNDVLQCQHHYVQMDGSQCTIITGQDQEAQLHNQTVWVYHDDNWP